MSEITPSVPDDNINWNYATVVSYVRITAPSGTVVTRISLSDNGLQYTSYRKDTVPASGTLCILSHETSELFFKLNAMECLSFHDSLLAFLRR